MNVYEQLSDIHDELTDIKVRLNHLDARIQANRPSISSSSLKMSWIERVAWLLLTIASWLITNYHLVD